MRLKSGVCLTGGFAAAALIWGGCASTLSLAQPKARYDALLAVPAVAAQALATRSALFQGTLERSRTPGALPYPAMAADLKAMAVEVGALGQLEVAGADFERDFNAFSVAHGGVVSQHSADWPAFQVLRARFLPIGTAIHLQQVAFNAGAAQFDALASQYQIAHFDPAGLTQRLTALRKKFNDGIGAMESRVRADQGAVEFDAGSNMDPDVLSRLRDTLGAMQEHLMKTEDLARRALELADSVRTSAGGPDGLWTGPGLPDDGSTWSKLQGYRSAFSSRRDEFGSLAEAFDNLENFVQPAALGQ